MFGLLEIQVLCARKRGCVRTRRQPKRCETATLPLGRAPDAIPSAMKHNLRLPCFTAALAGLNGISVAARTGDTLGFFELLRRNEPGGPP
jgi:hypothetical protein